MIQLVKTCLECGGSVVKTPTTSMRAWETRTKYCSRECANAAKIGRKHTPEHVAKVAAASKGRRHSLESIAKMSGENSHRWSGGLPKCEDCGERVANRNAKRCLACNRKTMQGETAPNWRGGITPENARIRNSRALAEWRTAVFVRDDFTCQCCGRRGGQLHADHIQPFSLFPELRADLGNGRTLCVPCHKKHGAMVYSGRWVREATFADPSLQNQGDRHVAQCP